MSNKIQGYGPQAPVVTGGAKTGPAERVAGADQKVAAVQAPTGDSVTLTGAARQLQKLAEAVAAAPVTDAERVANVKRAVANGTYEVNAERVADKIIAANRELPGR
jgi:negative regulator of flagellin synthesis FlgM